MMVEPLEVTVRFNFLGDSSPGSFHQASHMLHEKYSILVKTWEPYQYINMHAVEAHGSITYRRKSIMSHVYTKGLFKKKYLIDVVVQPDGSLILQRF